jgi:hypothetical protein
MCVKCGQSHQVAGAEPYCGSCYLKVDTPMMDWPSYDQTSVVMLATGKRCQRCNRQLYALPGDDRNSNICVDCV